MTTWDTYREEFTPQQGVRTGPYTLWSLRRALLALRCMGYDARRYDNSVLVEKYPSKEPS